MTVLDRLETQSPLAMHIVDSPAGYTGVIGDGEWAAEVRRLATLRRLAHPFWFQSFGAVMGMDWHSSGVTTTVCGALKQGIAGRTRELGFVVAGGKGRTSRATPGELTAAGMWMGVDPAPYIQASRMAAKVDNNALQDG